MITTRSRLAAAPLAALALLLLAVLGGCGSKEPASAPAAIEPQSLSEPPKIDPRIVKEATDERNADPSNNPNENLRSNVESPFPSQGFNSSIGLGGNIGGGGGPGGAGGMVFRRARGGGGMRAPRSQAADGGLSAEEYARLVDNPFHTVADTPLSTFSVDVDTASYSNVRRFLLDEHRLPPKDAVRLEELINYFAYDDAAPTTDAPFSVTTEVATCPWNVERRLLRVGVQARRLAADAIPPRNLVFLVDVSGSMQSQRKLPLLKRAFDLLIPSLTKRDRVAIVVYAGAAGMVLPPTNGDDHAAIRDALAQLQAGGSTNGGAGIALAYATARAGLIEGGVNRLILATDGDFNVGVSSTGELTRLVETEREHGVSLTVLGFGRGNLKDSRMEQLADKGNGNFAYIDNIAEARKVLVEQMAGTLVTVAKDVKLQLEFNPKEVEAYRLLGYVNRKLAARDFNDDTKDAGDIGAGHHVAALYEIVPAGQESRASEVDALKYQEARRLAGAAGSGELLTVKVRYKAPGGKKSKLLSFPVHDFGQQLSGATDDLRFAAAVAEFGMLLRGSKHAGQATWAQVAQLARAAGGADAHGYRAGFLKLIEAATPLAKARDEAAARAAGGGADAPATPDGAPNGR